MDGLKAKLKNSLQFRLAVALTLVMMFAAVVVGAIGFYSAFNDAHEWQDDQLREIATMVDTHHLQVPDNARAPNELIEPESHVVVQIIAAENTVKNDDEIHFPKALHTGLQTIKIDKLEWRVFVRDLKPDVSGLRLIVAQQTEARNELAEHAGFRTLIPILVITPFLILLILGVLRWMLAPMSKLSEAILLRDSGDSSALPEQDLPNELRPFVMAINSLLHKQTILLEQQRRFVADAAHELRSPLTAMTLQSQNLAMQELPSEARRLLSEFGRGLHRMNDLVGQLLSLARAQITPQKNTALVSVQTVVRKVFEELMPSADTKNIEIGYTQTADLEIQADELDIIAMLRNLLDNAIRYSTAGSHVDVNIYAKESNAFIEVKDNGPGIAAENLERIFEPFYRVLGTEETGSGLGLSIVRSIATRNNGEVTVHSEYASSTKKENGTLVCLRLPLKK